MRNFTLKISRFFYLVLVFLFFLVDTPVSMWISNTVGITLSGYENMSYVVISDTTSNIITAIRIDDFGVVTGVEYFLEGYKFQNSNSSFFVKFGVSVNK